MVDEGREAISHHERAMELLVYLATQYHTRDLNIRYLMNPIRYPKLPYFLILNNSSSLSFFSSCYNNRNLVYICISHLAKHPVCVQYITSSNSNSNNNNNNNNNSNNNNKVTVVKQLVHNMEHPHPEVNKIINECLRNFTDNSQGIASLVAEGFVHKVLSIITREIEAKEVNEGMLRLMVETLTWIADSPEIGRQELLEEGVIALCLRLLRLSDQYLATAALITINHLCQDEKGMR